MPPLDLNQHPNRPHSSGRFLNSIIVKKGSRTDNKRLPFNEGMVGGSTPYDFIKPLLQNHPEGGDVEVPLIDKDEFFIDLLFYHFKLKRFVVVELKSGPFKPEYAGKMGFYLAAVDAQLKQASDEPSIGMILCKTKKKFIVEYTPLKELLRRRLDGNQGL